MRLSAVTFRPWQVSSPAVLASPTIRCATPDSGNSTSRRKLNLGCGKICGTIVSVEFFTPVFNNTCPSLSYGWGRGFSCYSACLRGRPPPSRRPGGFVRIPSGSRSRRDECPPSWGIVAIELETRTCFAGGQGFGFEAGGWLPQASDGESMRHQRELDVSPNGWARRLRPTGAVTLPAQTGR